MFIDKNYDGKFFNLPLEDISPDNKSGNYDILWSKFIYSQFMNNRTVHGLVDINWINLMRQYATGRQSRDQYKNILIGEASPLTGIREGWMNIDFENIITPIPKYLRIVVGKMMSIDNDVFVDFVDETSAFSKAMKKAEIKLQSEFPELIQMAEKYGLEGIEKQNIGASTEDEFTVLENLGFFKLPHEIALEKNLIPFTLYESDETQMRIEQYYNLAVLGMAAGMDYYESVGKIYKAKSVDPANVIIENTGRKDLSDASFCGLMEYYTIADIRYNLESEGIPYDIKQLQSVACSYCGMFGNPPLDKWEEYKGLDDTTRSYRFDCFMIPVLSSYNKCNDTYYYKKSKGVRIQSKITPKELEVGKIKRIVKQTIRGRKWIVGSDITYESGIISNNSAECKLPIHFYRIDGKSMVEAMKPTADTVAITGLKLQNLIATAAPKGYDIEIGALENVSIGKKNFSPLDLIKLKTHTGVQVYRANALYGGQFSNKPITPSDGGIGSGLNECIAIFEFCFNQMAELSGIDRYSGVSKLPGSSATATGIQAAVSATNDALKPLYMAVTSIKQNMLKNICYRVLQYVSHTPIDETGYANVFTPEMLRYIKDVTSKNYIKLSMMVVDKPSEVMKQNVMMALQNALNVGRNGQPALTVSEYLYLTEQLNNGNGIKYARMYIAIKENKRDMEAKAMAQQNMQRQQQGTLQNTQLKGQSEMGILKTEKDLDLRNDVEIENLKHENKMKEKGLDIGLDYSAEQGVFNNPMAQFASQQEQEMEQQETEMPENQEQQQMI